MQIAFNAYICIILPLYVYIKYHVFVDRTQQTKRQQQKDTAMEVVDDVCESEGVCEVMCDVRPVQPEHGESMETHVSEGGMVKSASTEEHEDLSAVAHSAGNTSTEPLKPRYSYRLVFSTGLLEITRYSQAL